MTVRLRLHMTTAEFIGRTEDLNSTYDMIYMGMDSVLTTKIQMA